MDGMGEENPETSHHDLRMTDFHSFSNVHAFTSLLLYPSSSGSINGETASAYRYVIVAERGSLGGKNPSWHNTMPTCTPQVTPQAT